MTLYFLYLEWVFLPRVIGDDGLARHKRSTQRLFVCQSTKDLPLSLAHCILDHIRHRSSKFSCHKVYHLRHLISSQVSTLGVPPHSIPFHIPFYAGFTFFHCCCTWFSFPLACFSVKGYDAGYAGALKYRMVGTCHVILPSIGPSPSNKLEYLGDGNPY